MYADFGRGAGQGEWMRVQMGTEKWQGGQERGEEGKSRERWILEIGMVTERQGELPSCVQLLPPAHT